MPVEVAPNSRLLVVGASRSGKTTWVRARIDDLRGPVVFLDTKGERPTQEWAARRRFVFANGEGEGLRLVRRKDRPRRLIVRCYDPLGETANELLEALYHGPPTTVVVDEAMHWSSKSQLPRGLRLIITAGGGRDVGVWSCSQRPVDVHNTFLSESSHRVLFKIELEDDQKKIAPLMGLTRAGASAIGRLEKYHWLFKLEDAHAPLRHFAPIEVRA